MLQSISPISSNTRCPLSWIGFASLCGRYFRDGRCSIDVLRRIRSAFLVSRQFRILVQRTSYLNRRRRTVGIGPSGMLVEDNGILEQPGKAPYYNPVLGAGPARSVFRSHQRPRHQLCAGAQYLGFVLWRRNGSTIHQLHYEDGLQPPSSFGFASQPASCSAFAAQITAQGGILANPIYGGDFPNNDPSTSTDGYGNCDLAIDLGTQDSSNNGLYPNATVWMDGVSGHLLSPIFWQTYPFPAVAIAGQLDAKYAIFLIGSIPRSRGESIFCNRIDSFVSLNQQRTALDSSLSRRSGGQNRE